MNKKIIAACLSCMLLVSPFSANAIDKKIGYGINASIWLALGIILAKKKNLFKAPLKKPGYLALASICVVPAVFHLAKMIYSMANTYEVIEY